MKKFWTIFAGMALIFCCLEQFSAQENTANRQRLHVLYVYGKDDGKQRISEFRDLIEGNLGSFTSVSETEFTAKLAQEADVTIVDGDISERVPAGFSRPLILLGKNYQPLRLPETRGYKLKNSCQCLRGTLHSMQTEHPVFQGPFPVRPPLQKEIDPVTRREVQAWKFHEPLKNEEPEQKDADFRPIRYGIVVFGPNLRGAEDSEIISGGINTNGNYAVALAREANIFHWGPAASPSEMTGDGRNLFLNVIAYMASLGERQQTVRRGQSSRNDLPILIKGLINLKEDTDHTNYVTTRLFAREKALFGLDGKRYYDYYVPNLPFVFVPPAGTSFEIDEAVKRLEIPNNDPRLLDKCIDLLSDSKEAPTAKRILERYTGKQYRDQAEWRAWFEAHREDLYFADRYGYRFYTGPAGPPPPQKEIRNAAAEIKSLESKTGSPLSVSAAVVSDIDNKKPHSTTTNYWVIGDGAVATMLIHLKVNDGWEVALENSTSGKEPVNLDVSLPRGTVWLGGWEKLEGDGRYIMFARNLLFKNAFEPEKPLESDIRELWLRGSVRFTASKAGGRSDNRFSEPVEVSIGRY